MKPLKITFQILIALYLLFFTLCDCDNPVIDPPDPYDGPWEKVEVPEDLGNYALDFLGPNNGWVCGYENIGHWDGNSWSVVKRFGDSENKYYLYDIFTVSANDIWASGRIERDGKGNTGVVIHYDGTDWYVEEHPALYTFGNVWMFDDGTGWGGIPDYYIITGVIGNI